MIEEPDATSIDLTARRFIAASLSQALAEFHPGTRVGAPVWTDSHAGCLREAWLLLCQRFAQSPPAPLGLGELSPGPEQIQPLIDWLNLPAQHRADGMQQVFGLVVSGQCPQYETEYCHWKDPTYRAHHMADIAGFYRAFGLETSSDRPERPDHIALELEFLAFLLEKRCMAIDTEQVTICEEALTHFVRDHLAWWAPTFAKLTECRIELLLPSSATPAIRAALSQLSGVVELLRAYITAERCWNSIEPLSSCTEPSDSPPADEDESCCTTCSVAAGMPTTPTPT